MVLAPLADVTDAAFRRLIAKYSKWGGALPDDGARPQASPVGGPDVMWTEFVSADGLALAPEEGRQKLLADLIYSEAERPIVAQLFTSTPERMEAAARLCRELGFDGIDINMGCPDRSIEKQGAGAALIKTPERAREVVAAAKRGAGELPVSVKTRIGYATDELDTWLPELLKEDPAVVTVHARTRKEMSKVPARWEHVQQAVAIRDAVGSDARIFGNGDLHDLADAHEKVRTSGADGAMLGRAIFGNPWLFHPEKDLSNVSLEERLSVMVEHTELFEELLPHKNFAIMKKHYKAYVNGFDGAKELRAELMETNSAKEVREIVGNAKVGYVLA